jgi:hypothetical protein
MSQYLKRLEISNVGNVEEELQSQYLKRVDIVEVVDQDGNPWEPVPGPDPWDELVVNQKALLHESNIYEIGGTIYATTATYTGGDPETITYRWRWQWRQSAEGSWASSPWTNTTNELSQASYTIPNWGQVRFQSQARDASTDPVTTVSSFTTVKDVPAAVFDPITATVNDVEYDVATTPILTVLINDPLPIVVTHNGLITDASYLWESRNPPTPPLFGTPTAKDTVATLTAAGFYILTLTMSSPKADELKSVIIQFNAVDAL